MSGIFGFKKEDKPAIPEGTTPRGRDAEGVEHFSAGEEDYDKAVEIAKAGHDVGRAQEPPKQNLEPVREPSREVRPTQTPPIQEEKQEEELTDREKAIYAAGMERGALLMQKAAINAIMDLKP